ncbi:MAG: hypothetical protein JWO46_2988 [Nocardioidaceae bacterium]|nr:hypothetical protein [Nocardioidaceae bacterium]
MARTDTWLDGVLDDASTLPPVSAPLDQAVERHRSRPPLVRSLVVADTALADLAALTSVPVPVAVTVAVTGGAGALEPAVHWATSSAGVRLVALHARLRDEDDLARNAGRVVAMVDHLRSLGALAEDVDVHVEPPAPGTVGDHTWLAALDEIAMAGLGLTFRIGPDLDVARCIDAALDHETPFTFVGEVGHRIPHLLLATRASLDGDDVAAALADPDPVAALPDEPGLASVRRWFVSASVPDVAATIDELTAVGLPDRT